MKTNKRVFTPWVGVLLALCAGCLGFFAYLLVASRAGLYCISTWAYFLSGAMGMALFCLLLWVWLRPRRSVRVLLAALMMCAILTGICGGVLMRLFQRETWVYSSPEGPNRVVVFLGGAFGEELRAYPMMNRFMYCQTEDGAYPVSDVQVVVSWKSETKATVSFTSMGSPTEVSLPAGVIEINF